MAISIQPIIKSVFIKVSDMDLAIQWYSKLLHFEYEKENDFGNIYVIPLTNGTNILLDSHNAGEVTPSPHELFMFSTDSIDEAYKELQELNVEIVKDDYGEIYRDNKVSFINFKDLNGHVLMVCEEHAE
ncbi:VOC family protein [Metabacillus arenae]|uniref:VOC family protein n=1 Tax=Metabacillus arenae TaxID=2771434 RepID=A0A926RYV7_9BACI|nr:VOC family protein [Metabacillus arenae]MBD1381572.1 VOC family protein [Metabacillus arenae]